MGFVASHPSRKNKNAARVGHPGFLPSLFPALLQKLADELVVGVD